MTEFWWDKGLTEFSADEWEALCYGCGRCCLLKLEDEDTGEVYFTNVACRMLDLHTCRCRDYARRAECVPDCLVLRPFSPELFAQLPSTCAYRLLTASSSMASSDQWRNRFGTSCRYFRSRQGGVRGVYPPRAASRAPHKLGVPGVAKKLSLAVRFVMIDDCEAVLAGIPVNISRKSRISRTRNRDLA